ncbi:sulfur carrier protein ThiS [Dongshaea marina]|uniref:sulfur carrier protein ThiS n=1 Tax=Dongshaea marina TaxID=2047966 RepID=UPI000D3EDCFC|nr:sulfur carrier protein ThiS [Dongshaea marina]
MQLIINDTPMTFEPGVTLNELLTKLKWQKPGIAIAINQQIIAQASWETHPLSEGDEILLFQAIAGG